jgi:hypothetical protein
MPIFSQNKRKLIFILTQERKYNPQLDFTKLFNNFLTTFTRIMNTTMNYNGVPIAMTMVFDQNTGTYTMEYQSFVIVHKDHTGFVIGARGATVKQIGKSSRTWVHVMPANEFTYGHPWFIIKGRSQENVATAHHYITTIGSEAQRRLPRAIINTTPNAADGGGSWVGTQDRINMAEYWAMTDTAAQWYAIPEYEETFLRVNGGYMTEDDYEHDAALTHFQVTSDDEYFMNEYNAMFPEKRVRFTE